MAKLTKKSLKSALSPVRKAAERVATAEINARRSDPQDRAAMRTLYGPLAIEARISRRSRVVPHVPFPYAVVEISYYITHTEYGALCAGWPGTAEAADQVFLAARRRNLTLEA